MTNPTGAFVYDIPETASHEVDLRSAAHKRNANVLGKAVHPAALQRLHELWPHAKVFVKHHWFELTPEEALGGEGARCATVVVIVKHPDDPDSPRVTAAAVKHPNDRWERRTGIRLAFRRALQSVRFVESE